MFISIILRFLSKSSRIEQILREYSQIMLDARAEKSCPFLKTPYKNRTND